MKVSFVSIVIALLYSFNASAQSDSLDCTCDTTFYAFEPGTFRHDSINWKSIECFYIHKRTTGHPLSVINYKNGQRHGTYAVYHPKNYWIHLRQRGYQQGVPRRYKKLKDFYHREGKSLFGKSETGNYVNGKKDGVWHMFDTNQRIVLSTAWKNGEALDAEEKCKGLLDTPGFHHRSDFDSVGYLVSALPDGEHALIHDENAAISYTITDHKLNGQVRIYTSGKRPTLYSSHQFKDNCLVGSSVTFSIKGDTTRIESNYSNSVPYKIVSYTPSSRGVTYYRDPTHSYELESDYRNGLIVLRREKHPIKKP
ncbi:MAG: antitoxin component YwqK of YwqJK toxin-antitoxin module [Flavobacteriaceae bacterium]|jgi:antitoxin component YwqK of YwqJK toxin-antitoxin module